MATLTMETYIHEQPAALARLLTVPPVEAAERVRALAPRKAWFVGSGTSLYAGMVAARAWETSLRLDAEAISSLEFLDDVQDWQLGPGVAVVAISQSGATLTLAEGLERARRLGSLAVAVTSDPTSVLAQAADVVADSATGPEEIFAKTKGFTTTAAAACLVGLLADGGSAAGSSLSDLPRHAADVIDQSERVVDAWVERFAGARGLFVVGSGALVPAAYEGALKVLEVGKLLVEGRELEEIQHGYFNAIGPETGLVLLAGALRQIEKLESFRAAAAAVGAPLAVVAERSLVGSTLDAAGVDVVLPTPSCPEAAAILGAIPLQLLAFRLALRRGVDPNRTRYPDLYRVFRTKSMYL